MVLYGTEWYRVGSLSTISDLSNGTEWYWMVLDYH